MKKDGEKKLFLGTVLIFFIKIYQKLFSFDHAFWKKYAGNYRVCIYHPSCSEYTVLAIKKHGAFNGMLMGIARILRCNPFSKGGNDLVPDKVSFRRNTEG